MDLAAESATTYTCPPGHRPSLELPSLHPVLPTPCLPLHWKPKRRHCCPCLSINLLMLHQHRWYKAGAGNSSILLTQEPLGLGSEVVNLCNGNFTCLFRGGGQVPLGGEPVEGEGAMWRCMTLLAAVSILPNSSSTWIAPK